MKNLSKLLSIILALVLILSMLTACSTGEKTETPTNANAEVSSDKGVDTKDTAAKTEVVEFWCDKALKQDASDALQATWTDNSDYNIEISSYQDPASYQTALQQALDQPTSPNLFTWWSGGQLETLALNEKIVDITDQWPALIEAGISPDIQEAFTIDGKTYAAPYSILYNTCVYNVNAFAKVGITDTPKDFDEFLDNCEKLKAAGITPIGIKNDAWASFIWFQEFVGAFDPQLYLDICSGAKDYTDPDLVKVMEVWKEMMDKGYFAEPVYYRDMYRALAQEEIAMMLEPNTAFTILEDEYGLAPESDVSAFAVPSMNGHKDVIFFEATPIVVSAANANIPSSLEALQSFYSVAAQQEMVDYYGIVNTSKTVLDNPAIENIVKLTSDNDTNQLILRFYENTNEDIRDLAIDELSKFMYSSSDINTILSTIQAKADEVWAK